MLAISHPLGVSHRMIWPVSLSHFLLMSVNMSVHGARSKTRICVSRAWYIFDVERDENRGRNYGCRGCIWAECGITVCTREGEAASEIRCENGGRKSHHQAANG